MSGIRLAEVVLRTTDYDRLCDFYSLLLGQLRSVEMTPKTPPGSEDSDAPTRICFFNFYFDHPYTERIAVFECADAGPGKSSRGLHHFQLRVPSIDALLELYSTLKAAGHHPVESANHGPGTSLYYLDPDKNKIELSSLNFSSQPEMQDFMATPEFRTNPNGFPIDPERLLEGQKAGRDLSKMVWER
jgi:catechol 2,3-dioxygenase-like lactoylglutathione lyase family enzyme